MAMRFTNAWKKRLGFLEFSAHFNIQNAELFALTYGSLVAQLIKDTEDYEQVNKQLEKMYA